MYLSHEYEFFCLILTAWIQRFVDECLPWDRDLILIGSDGF